MTRYTHSIKHSCVDAFACFSVLISGIIDPSISTPSFLLPTHTAQKPFKRAPPPFPPLLFLAWSSFRISLPQPLHRILAKMPKSLAPSTMCPEMQLFTYLCTCFRPTNVCPPQPKYLRIHHQQCSANSPNKSELTVDT